MSIIKITQEDIDRNKPIDPGWHKMRVKTFEEAASKAGDSINYFVVLETTDGQKTLSKYACMFNSKAVGRMIPFFEAFVGSKIEAEQQFDFKNTIGQELWVEISMDTNNGQLYPKASGFAHRSTNPAF